MLEMIISLALWIAVPYLGYRFALNRVKNWLADRGYELSFRVFAFAVLAIASALGLAILGGSVWTSVTVLAIVFLYVATKKLSITGGSGAVADVMDDSSRLSALAAPFEPAPHIEKARKAGKDQIFMGLDAFRKPILFPRKKLDKNHLEILGESGVGKSSLAGVMLSQFAAAGECVVIFDPKADRMLPGVLARAGKKHGFPVINVDLRYGQPAQLNPFLGARRDQVEELLQVALELGKTGHGAVDFYRGKDREATGFMAEAFEDGQTSMPELLARAAEDERVTENENLWREFRQISRIPAFQVHEGQEGHDLEKLLSHPGIVYVTGSTTRLEVQAGQKLLLQRILQILDERNDQSMPVAIFLDELKYILSPAALRAAGTIRDRNCHLIFAHQSLGDLSDCPGLDPKAVRGAVWGNCGLKIAYRMLDSETARELSSISGDRAAIDTKTTESDNGKSISTGTVKSAHMPAHVFTHLPKPVDDEASVGVIIGAGPAYFVATRWLPAGPAPEPIPAPLHTDNVARAVTAAGAMAAATTLDSDARVDLSSLHAEHSGATNPTPDNDAILSADFNDLLT